MTRRLGSVLALFTLLLPDTSRAWCRSTTDQTAVAPTECNMRGVPLAWKRRCFSYSLDENGSASIGVPAIRGVLARSFGHWEDVECNGQSIGLDFAESEDLATCQEAEYSSKDGNVNVVAFVDDFEERMLMPSAYAVTIVWHSQSTGEIYDADMLVNEELGPYGVCASDGCSDPNIVDLENVITHEAGHFLGLAHAAGPDSTMFYEAPRGQISKRTLDADDIAGICTVYPIGSLPAACKYDPRHGLDVDCVHESSGRCSVPGASPRREPGGAPLVLVALCAIGAVLVRRRVVSA